MLTGLYPAFNCTIVHMMPPTDLDRTPESPSTDRPVAASDVLRRLAERVRELRGRRRMSRVELARASGLSTRFLARIEAGDGNVSILRLSDLALALGIELGDLLRRVEPSAGTRRVVSLVGLRGAGKSTVGPLLADRLGLPFVEMDDRIREASGLTLDQLFELHGEGYYRRLERETLAGLLSEGGPAVLAAAGGVVNDPTTWRRLLRRTRVVWLRAAPEDHWNRVVVQGDRRPMTDHPDAMAELRAILDARAAAYARAHVTVDTSAASPEEIATRIEDALTRLPEGLEI